MPLFGLAQTPKSTEDVCRAIGSGQIDMYCSETYFSLVFPDSTIYAVRKDYIALPVDSEGMPTDKAGTAGTMYLNASLFAKCEVESRC